MQNLKSTLKILNNNLNQVGLRIGHVELSAIISFVIFFIVCNNIIIIM